jgi:hypothetical protein
MTMTFTEGTAGAMLDDIARSIQASEGITYEQAFSRAVAEHPSYYQQYSETFREENLGRAEQAQQPRQQAELDGPGRATERHMLDQAEAIVQAKMARGANRYEALTQAYAENPELSALYDSVQSIKAFAESDIHEWGGSPGPGNSAASLAYQTGNTSLQSELSNALLPLQKQYPGVPRDFLLAKLYDGDKGLRKRAIARCHGSV